MLGGTLAVSRAEKLFPLFKMKLETFGFTNVTMTAAEKDGLYMLIDELKPRLLMMDSRFYEAGTPYMMGELLKVYPKLNTVAVSIFGYPVEKALGFIQRGVKSYLDLWEGLEEFKKGLRLICEGREYISPKLKALMDNTNNWPDVKQNVSKRLMECLTMLCCGFRTARIGDFLHISKKTVEIHLQHLYDIFHVDNREEMVGLAWRLKLVTEDDCQFYDNRTLDFPLPDWAAAKIKLNRRTA
jgi:DNA-binding NarL/FixJ family response regulator